MNHYFYPQTQPPASTNLSETGTPSQSGYLVTDGSNLSFVNSAGTSAGVTAGIAQLQTVRMQVGAAAKNPSAVGLLAGGLLVPGDVTVDSVRVGAGTLPTGASDAFSFNVLAVGVGDLFETAQVWAREPNVTGFAKTVNDGAAYTSYLTEVTGTGTAALAIDTLANGDWFVAGYSDVFAGVRLDMDGANVNAEAATLTAEYWDGSDWAAMNATDGTASGGAPLAQDGAVTWPIPADWQQNAIGALGTKYWVRFSVDAAMTAGTAVDNADVIRAVNHLYAFTPDQNTALEKGVELRLHCTEADANAAGLTFQVSGEFG